MSTSLDKYARLSQPALRLRVGLAATVAAGVEAPRAAEVLNISATGCYIGTSQPAAVGSRVRLAITLPAELGSHVIAADGVVRWVNGPAGPVTAALPLGMGVQFITLGDNARPGLVAVLEHVARIQLDRARETGVPPEPSKRP